MTQYNVHITSAETREGTSRAGNDYKMVQIQGILENGNDRQIFRTILPNGAPEPKVGQYVAEFQPRTNNQTMELEGGIVSLTPRTK